MSWAAVATVAASVISSEMQSGAAEDAANAQQKGTDASIAEQRRQYDLSRADMLKQNETNRADLAPWRTAGGASVGRLSELMGIDTAPAPGSPDAVAAAKQRGPAPTREQFMRAGAGGPTFTGGTFKDLINQVRTAPQEQVQGGDGAFDEAGYNTALAQWEASAPPAEQEVKPPVRGPDFGALTAPISPAKKFTLADFWDDPVTKASYQQGLEQGTKALTTMAGARGSLNSGATLKALERFGIDYTGNQAAGSEGRFTRNENDIYGREVARRDTLFNRLSGIAGTGQTATTNTAQLGQNNANTTALIGANSANQVGNLLSAQGNARGAAAIAGGNAMSGGIQNVGNTVANWWQRQNQNQYSGYDRVNDPWGGP